MARIGAITLISHYISLQIADCKGFTVNFLLAMRVFWGATVSNFRYFRMSAASDLYCMLMAEFLVAAKGTLRARFGNWQRA
jgi:hypothetical protein